MPQEKRWRVDCEDERGLPRTALCRAGGQEGCPDVVREKSVGRLGNRTEAVGISLVEVAKLVTVNVEHANDFSASKDRHNDL